MSTSSSIPTSSSTSTSSSIPNLSAPNPTTNHPGVLVGAILGSLAGGILLSVGGFLLYKKRRNHEVLP
jgi:hypothetical protein